LSPGPDAAGLFSVIPPAILPTAIPLFSHGRLNRYQIAKLNGKKMIAVNEQNDSNQIRVIEFQNGEFYKDRYLAPMGEVSFISRQQQF